jgi:hypothetical protein
MQHRRNTPYTCYISDKFCFHLQARKAPILVNPLDRAFPSHWAPVMSTCKHQTTDRVHNLYPHSLLVLSFGLYQACSSRLLLFGARGHQEPKPGGHLALQQGDRDPSSDVWGTKGWFIKGLGASGLKGPEPIYQSIKTESIKGRICTSLLNYGIQ